MVLAVFLVSLLAISAVSAASDSAGDMVSADINCEFSLDKSNDEGLVLSTMVETQSWGSNPKSFTDLNSLINVEYALNDTIFLNDDYVYVGEEDSPFPDDDEDYKDGVVIDRPLSIYGNGSTIDGSHLARIFDVTSSDVVFYNVNFINGCANDGGAIRGDCTVVDSTFANNEASKGGAMYGGTAIYCLFADNSVDFNQTTYGTGQDTFGGWQGGNPGDSNWKAFGGVLDGNNKNFDIDNKLEEILLYGIEKKCMNM